MKNYVCVVLWLSSIFCFGKPDKTSEIERPCPVYDLNCIRDFFENHAHCKKTFGPVPEPINRAQTNRFLSTINITISTGTLQISGLNGRVEEFYVNRKTDQLVIAVEFKNTTQSSNNVYFQFHRRAKEPIVTRSPGSISYSSVITTAVIPNLKDLQLQDAECTTFSNDAAPSLLISPSAGESSGSMDPQTSLAFARFITNMPVNTQEFFLTDSAYYIATFIQYTICDFGLFLT